MPLAKGTRIGGRQKGTPNKVTADVKAAAAKYTDEALRTLAKIMSDGESEQARVSAANAILDRAHGKPKQAVEHSGEDGAPILHSMVVTFVEPKHG